MPGRRVPLIGCALGLLLTATAFQVAPSPAGAPLARGLTAVHHFEYEDANAAFIQVRLEDPGFVMAYRREC